MELKKSPSAVGAALSLYIFAVLFLTSAMMSKTFYQALSSLRASSVLHSSLLENVLGATVGWHDTQPTGRKINRFSADIDTVDTNTMNRLQDFLDCLLGSAQVIA